MAIVSGTFDSSPYDNNGLLKDIRSLGFLNMETGPWVAGGAVRRVLTGEERGGDIDIFINGDNKRHTIRRVIETICARGDFHENSEPVENDAFFEYVLVRRPPKRNIGEPPSEDTKYRKVQVIKNRTFKSAEHLINDFDFTVCMAATDGWNWIADEKFMHDIDSKELILNNADQRDKNILRLAKYCKYGFMPTPGVFATMLGLDKLEEKLLDTGYMETKRDNY